MKLLIYILNFYRHLRRIISTLVLRFRASKCGNNSGAARIPHIGSCVNLEVGDWSSFNGFTATGWGGYE